jgi:hypothetical protein
MGNSLLRFPFWPQDVSRKLRGISCGVAGVVGSQALDLWCSAQAAIVAVDYGTQVDQPRIYEHYTKRPVH